MGRRVSYSSDKRQTTPTEHMLHSKRVWHLLAGGGVLKKQVNIISHPRINYVISFARVGWQSCRSATSEAQRTLTRSHTRQKLPVLYCCWQASQRPPCACMAAASPRLSALKQLEHRGRCPAPGAC